MRHFIKIQLALGLLHSIFINKFKNWRELPQTLLFLVAFFFAIQASLVTMLLSQVDFQALEYILNNICEPRVFLIFLILLAYGALGMWYTLATAKVSKVLIA